MLPRLITRSTARSFHLIHYADAVVTTETRYQYSDVNVVAIQHALQQTGLKAQPVDVIVTLPISEYLDANNQKNKQNIERKKKCDA